MRPRLIDAEDGRRAFPGHYPRWTFDRDAQRSQGCRSVTFADNREPRLAERSIVSCLMPPSCALIADTSRWDARLCRGAGRPCPAPSPAKAIDEFFPTFGNPGIDVRHYALRLDVKGKSERVAGRAVLTIEATSRLPEFSLDLSNLWSARWRSTASPHVTGSIRASSRSVLPPRSPRASASRSPSNMAVSPSPFPTPRRRPERPARPRLDHMAGQFLCR